MLPHTGKWNDYESMHATIMHATIPLLKGADQLHARSTFNRQCSTVLFTSERPTLRQAIRLHSELEFDPSPAISGLSSALLGIWTEKVVRSLQESSLREYLLPRTREG
jgi:hypothetical protein